MLSTACMNWRVPVPRITTAPQRKPSDAGKLKYLERTHNSKGDLYLYYKRGGKREPLPQPEGSEAFRIAYDRAAARFAPASTSGGQDVAGAISAYLASSDFADLSPASKRDYRYYLHAFSREAGAVPVADIGPAWLEGWRETYINQPNYWNALRARMTSVTAHFMRRNPGVVAANPWPLSRRLKTKPSDQNRPWPPSVLQAVFGAASPEFRALLTVYLLTAQRGGDVIRLSSGQFNVDTGILVFSQGKTGEPMALEMPEALASVLRQPLRSPRGYAWTIHNAQDHLRCLLRRLGLPRYTLHGLRSTGPTALKHMGFENRVLRALTGHTSDRNLETYLRGVAKAPMAKTAMDALAGAFGSLATPKS